MTKKILLSLWIGLFTVSASWAGCPPLSGGSSCSSGIKGTTTSDNAAAGNVGEYVVSAVTGVPIPLSGVWGDITSISLTPGDWDLSLNTSFGTVTSLTATNLSSGISATSGNSGAGMTTGDDQTSLPTAPTSACNVNMVIPAKRVSISATTTYYAKMILVYSGGAATVSARLSARRVR